MGPRNFASIASITALWIVISILPPFAANAEWPKAVDQETAWAALPKADKGTQAKLPTWVRMLAPTLPHTTAALIELEQLYRTEPIASDARTNICIARYSVAEFHHSEYGKSVAVSDLKRTGSAAVADELKNGAKGLSPSQREIYDFAAQLAKSGKSITDEQFASVHKQLGNDAMVGLVLQIAHGCFQDRLLCALGIADIADASETPTEIHFTESTQNGANTPSADREDPKSLLDSIAKDKSLVSFDLSTVLSDAKPQSANWEDFNFSGLQKKLGLQRDREPRIAVPEWDSIVNKLPPNLYRRPLRIRWSRVVVGYQPKLGPAWIKCLRVFEQEAHQNRVFEESVFWVVTRSLRCFYCMGHCEMLMEVGGLNQAGINERTSRLADTDWSSFSEPERTAFRFAKKLTETPNDISEKDRDEIRQSLGDVRALDLIWWASRCQYMTKISDAFQLQLERENVFAD